MDIFDFILYFGYLLFAVSVISVIVLPLVKAMDNPKTLVKSGVGVAVLFGVFLISFLVSRGDNVEASIAEKFELTSTGVKVIGATLTTLYVMGIGSILGIVYTEIVKMIK